METNKMQKRSCEICQEFTCTEEHHPEGKATFIMEYDNHKLIGKHEFDEDMYLTLQNFYNNSYIRFTGRGVELKKTYINPDNKMDVCVRCHRLIDRYDYPVDELKKIYEIKRLEKIEFLDSIDNIISYLNQRMKKGRTIKREIRIAMAEVGIMSNKLRENSPINLTPVEIGLRS